jgi:PAS domain S-box-containing protein
VLDWAMSSIDGPAPLRVVVLGEEAELAEWRSILEGRDVDVRLAKRFEGTPQAGEFVVATVPLREARAVLETATAGGGGLMILAREGDGPHLGTGLIKAIARGKREWEMALDVLTDAVVIVDPAGSVLRANRAFAGLVGRSFSELLSRPLRDLLGTPVGDQPDHVQRVLDGEPAASGDARFSVVAGVHQVHAMEVFGSPRGPRTVVVSLRDITALREQQQRQELSHRLADIGRLAAGVAHEISTPLASIALRAESLLRKAEDESLRSNTAFEAFPRYLKTIEEESFRCKRIIGGLLDFCRARRPEVSPTQVNALVETAVALIGDHARLKHVTLATQLDATLPHVALDAHQMREVIVALVLNALDASAPGGAVSVSTSRQGEDHLRITVSDGGEGIPPENLERIFVPFFTTRPPGQAVGLGLSISDGIVRGHGGEILVESNLGTGTTVTVQLPLRGLAATAATPGA